MRKFLLILLTCSCFNYLSCVDADYDLKKHIEPIIIASDSISIPLFKTDSLHLQDWIENKDIDNIELIDGAYHFIMHDSLSFDVIKQIDQIIEEQPDFGLTFDVPKSSLPNFPPGFPMPMDMDIPITQKTKSYNLSSSIVRLDTISFNTSVDVPNLEIVTTISDIKLLSGVADCEVVIYFPKTFLVADQDNDAIAGNVITKRISLKNKVNTFDLQVKEMYSATSGVIKYQPTISIKRGAKLTIGPNPKIVVNALLKNVDVKRMKGLINTTFPVENISIKGINWGKLSSNSNNIYSFENPIINITTRSNIGIPMIASVLMKSMKQNSSYCKDSVKIQTKPSLNGNYEQINRYGLGLKTPLSWTGEPWIFFDVNRLMKNNPDSVLMEISGKTFLDVDSHYYREKSYFKVNYLADIPIVFSNDFSVSICDTMLNVFSENILNAFCTDNGSLSLSGKVENGIPIDLFLKIKILDSNLKDLKIDIPEQEINACLVSNLTNITQLNIHINQGDLYKMKQAKNIEISFSLKTDAAGQKIILEGRDFVKAYFKLVKRGGIQLN